VGETCNLQIRVLCSAKENIQSKGVLASECNWYVKEKGNMKMGRLESVATGLSGVLNSDTSGAVYPSAQERLHRDGEVEAARFSEIKKHENRQDRRYAVHRIVGYKYGGRRLLTLTLDLSLGGMRIETHHDLPIGGDLGFKLVLEAGFMWVRGKIVHSGTLPQKQSVSGVQFIDLSPGDHARLLKCLVRFDRPINMMQPSVSRREDSYQSVEPRDQRGTTA
jgi:hypothetical protein